MENKCMYNYQYLVAVLKAYKMSAGKFAKIANIGKSTLCFILRGEYYQETSKIGALIIEGLKKIGQKNTEVFLDPFNTNYEINDVRETNYYKTKQKKNNKPEAQMLQNQEENPMITFEMIQHFNLKTEPFQGGIVQDVFFSAENKSIINNTLYSIANGNFLCVIGAVGSGKSTLSTHIKKILIDDPGIKLGVIPNMLVRRADDRAILNTIVEKFGDGIIPAALRMRQSKMLSVLSFMGEENIKPVIFIDEAQRLSLPMMKDLKLLWEENKNEGIPVSIILFGQPALYSNLVQSSMKEVFQRVDMIKIKSFQCPKAKTKDVAEYIRFKISLAGGDPEMFDLPAIEKIAKVATTPLDVNVICRRALQQAYEISSRKIDLEIMNTIIK